MKIFNGSFGSSGFWFVMQVACITFLFLGGVIARNHLATEQRWSAELLSQNTHSLEIVARQKHYISVLENILTSGQPTE